MDVNKERENQLSWERLTEILDYDVNTGIFTNKISGIRRVKGSIAGHLINSTGYVTIKIDSHAYRAHRLAWLYCFKEWPEGFIDHIDGNKSNNCIDNLREASNRENKQNGKIQANNTSGYKGVSFEKCSGKYKAYIRVEGRLKNLGRYNTAEEASIMYKQAAVTYFGEFYNEGTS